MKKGLMIDRRSFLRGTGAACFLPHLDVMAAPAVAPKRFCSVFFPFGVCADPHGGEKLKELYWYPKEVGKGYALTNSLKPLQSQKQFSILSGLSHPQCRHMAHIANHYLTGSSLKRGVVNHESIDQVVARHLGKQTRVTSLQLSTEASGISIAPDGKALPGLRTPRAAFEYLFSGTRDVKEITRRRVANMKVVDSVLDDYRLLHKKLGRADADKMDEYLTTVNELEEKLKKAEKWESTPMPQVNKTLDDFPAGKIPAEEYFDLMYEIMFLAFETDQTRVTTFMYGSEAASKSTVNKFAGPVIGGGNLHVAGHKGQWPKLALWDEFMSARLATFMTKLDNSKSRYGSLLDNTVILHGSSTSSPHSYRNYPLILAGGKNLGYDHGAHRTYDEDIPFNNLLLSMAKSVDVPIERYHDSTGTVDDIFS
jgi:hypothetical protein